MQTFPTFLLLVSLLCAATEGQAGQEELLLAALNEYCLTQSADQLIASLDQPSEGVRPASIDLLVATIVAPSAERMHGWEVNKYQGEYVRWVLTSFFAVEQGRSLYHCGLLSVGIQPSVLLRHIEVTLPVERWYFAPMEDKVQHAYKLTAAKEAAIRLVVPDLQDYYSTIILETVSLETVQ